MPASLHDARFDELGYLDRAWVSDTEVSELAGGEIVDGGGTYPVCM